MKVHVVSIVDAFGQELVTKVFSTEEKAAEWQRNYVKENWKEHYDDECPTDLDEAVHDYFFGGVVEDENLVSGEYEVDEEELDAEVGGHGYADGEEEENQQA